MADGISDADLRKELRQLSGKDVGPVLPSTRPALVKKLLRLRNENNSSDKGRNKSALAPQPGDSSGGNNNSKRIPPGSPSLGFSSDEEQPETAAATRLTSSIKKPKSTAGSKRTSDVPNAGKTARKSEIGRGSVKVTSTTCSTTDGSYHSIGTSVNGFGRQSTQTPSEESILQLSNDEIQSRLYELSGTRYPVSDSTKRTYAKRLQKLLSGGYYTKGGIENASVDVKKIVIPSPPEDSAMETQFSDSDDDIMDYEPSPPVASNVHVPMSRPEMTNRSVNTSSFLDATLPDPPGDDPDCFIAPMPKTDSHINRLSSGDAHGEVSPELPSKLPSPNLSSTRRSFIPPSNISSPRYTKPVPPSPPRSGFARRPLASSHFANLNSEVTPKPTSQFSSVLRHPKATTPSHDYTTGYSTGSGKVIDPNPTSTKRAKVAKDVDMTIRGKGKHESYLYSKALLIGFGVFLALLAVLYIYLKLTTPEPLDSVFEPNDEYESLLEVDEPGKCQRPRSCFPEGQLRDSKRIVESLCTFLSQHAGYFECDWEEYKERHLAEVLAKKEMKEVHGKDVVYLWDAVLALIMRNPHWGIRLKNGKLEDETSDPGNVRWLESVNSTKPWSCIIGSMMVQITLIVVAAVVVALLGYLAFLFGHYWKRQKQREEDLYYELIESIIDLLEAQYNRSRDNVDEKPYVAVSHVHDTLITPAERAQKQGMWKKAVRFINTKETRVREEIQEVQGEELTVWRWLQSSDPRTPPVERRWQGSAVGSHRLNFRPTQCLKIRGMFDVYSESGSEWPIQIQDAILEKLGDKHGVVHMAVDTESDENRVYAKFATAKQAGKAYEALNGSYYSGECVQCKFLLLKKYHQKFPHAENSTAPLKRSNQVLGTLPATPRLYPTLPSLR